MRLFHNLGIMIYKVGTVTPTLAFSIPIVDYMRLSQSRDYDLQGWDYNQFPHWYFIPNIGLRATLFHNLGIMIYKLGTVTIPTLVFHSQYWITCDPHNLGIMIYNVGL